MEKTIQAVVFDMDGVLIESEVIWRQVRETFAAEHGLTWSAQDQQAAMGCNTRMWSAIMVERMQLRQRLGMDEAAIAAEIKGRLLAQYQAHLPERAGALDAVRRIARHCTVALASGSPNELADYVMQITGMKAVFAATTYGDDVICGKPAPDIWLDVLKKIGVSPQNAVGVEDSANGIRSLHAAGMGIIAAPGPQFPLPADVLALAHARIDSMHELTPALLARVAANRQFCAGACSAL